jgi:hypothetical protein
MKKSQINICSSRLIYLCLGIGFIFSNPLKVEAQSSVYIPTQEDLENQQLAIQAMQVCAASEVELRQNPSNYQANTLYNTCLSLIMEKSLCTMQVTSQIGSSKPANMHKCDEGLANFYREWGTR